MTVVTAWRPVSLPLKCQMNGEAAPPFVHTRRLACYAALALGACAAATQRLQPAASRQHSALLQADGHNDYAPYPASKDPWLASWAGKGSYRLWARDYESRHGDGNRYNSLYGTHGLARSLAPSKFKA